MSTEAKVTCRGLPWRRHIHLKVYWHLWWFVKQMKNLDRLTRWSRDLCYDFCKRVLSSSSTHASSCSGFMELFSPCQLVSVNKGERQRERERERERERGKNRWEKKMRVRERYRRREVVWLFRDPNGLAVPWPKRVVKKKSRQERERRRDQEKESENNGRGPC